MTNTEKLEQLQKELARLEEIDFYDSMSNDFYYTRGNGYEMSRKIADLRKQINDLKEKI